MYCTNCGAALGNQARFCAVCGVGQAGPSQDVAATIARPAPEPIRVELSLAKLTAATAPIPPGHSIPSPWGAVALSLLLVGLPEIIMGQNSKGVVMMVAAVLLAAASGLLLLPVIWIVAAMDAYQMSQRFRNGQPVGRWTFFFYDFSHVMHVGQ